MLRWILLAFLGLFGMAEAAEVSPLTIDTARGPRHFSVELARTPAQMALGLMFRQSLASDSGMLFVYGSEQPVAFWMKNTYVPLDMIFIRKDGRILRIAENTEPLSERLVPSGGPVLAVLEVIGGTAKKLGLAAGDRVSYPIFSDGK